MRNPLFLLLALVVALGGSSCGSKNPPIKKTEKTTITDYDEESQTVNHPQIAEDADGEQPNFLPDTTVQKLLKDPKEPYWFAGPGKVWEKYKGKWVAVVDHNYDNWGGRQNRQLKESKGGNPAEELAKAKAKAAAAAAAQTTTNDDDANAPAKGLPLDQLNLGSYGVQVFVGTGLPAEEVNFCRDYNLKTIQLEQGEWIGVVILPCDGPCATALDAERAYRKLSRKFRNRYPPYGAAQSKKWPNGGPFAVALPGTKFLE